MRRIVKEANGSFGATGEVLARFSRLIQDRPAAARAEAAFTEVLSKIEHVDRQRRSSGSVRHCPIAAVPRRQGSLGPIPVLGRAAADVPQFWTYPGDVVALGNQLGQALMHLGEGHRLSARSQLLGSDARPHDAALVQLAKPVELAGLSVAELLESGALAGRWPEAFALRIDGNSMDPLLREGDLVVVSPKQVARSGRPAVIQLAGQIGVTCKVYRRGRSQVRLIPANPAYPTTAHPIRDVLWALRVLARVRLSQ